MAPVTLQVTDLAATDRLTHLADQHGSAGRCIESAGGLVLIS
jgi:hypothetical protein